MSGFAQSVRCLVTLKLVDSAPLFIDSYSLARSEKSIPHEPFGLGMNFARSCDKQSIHFLDVSVQQADRGAVSDKTAVR